MSALRISLLGPLEISVNRKPIEVASNYVRALLCFLAIEKNRPHRREALAEMLWPGKPDGVARNSLKQALSNLRKALGDRDNPAPFILVSRDEIQFNQSSHYQVDALEFAELIEGYEKHNHDGLVTCKACQNRLLDTIALYRGDFLSNFYLPDNQEFNDWIILKREVYQRQVAEALRSIALIYENQGELARAVEYAQQLTELEPWNEENHRNLMRLLALNGMRSAALRQYQICCDDLARELDVQPSNATQTLYEKIKSWEPGAFLGDDISPVFAKQPDQVSITAGDVVTVNKPPRKLTRRSVSALIIAGIILGIGSIYWLRAPSHPLAANAVETKGSSITTSAAIPSPIKTETTEPTSTPVVFLSASTNSEKEMQALIAIHEQTNGPNWGNLDGWLSDLPPCDWYGVTCRGDKIVELELHHNQLNGTIPAEIGQLSDLENLDLGDNQLRGNIPPEIGDLSKLRHLILWGNRELSGPIPPELGNLSNLEDLALAHWESGGSLLSGEIPPELGNLKKLRFLGISVSLLQGPLPVELCELTYLEDLYLDSNRLSGSIPPEIGNLVSLGTLDLSGNDFEGPIPPELGSLSMLSFLGLGSSLISGEVPAELGNLVRLRNLSLDNTNLSGPLPLTLMNLKLREFLFFGTHICEPADEAFQAWLTGTHDLKSSGIVCPPEGD